MDILNILTAVLVLGLMGAIFAAMLGVASKVFEVKEDDRLPLIVDVLPGANCGACGYAGCANFAGGVIAGNAKVNGCPVGGDAVAEKVAEIMGAVADKKDKEVAYVYCNGGNEAIKKFTYDGPMDCITASKTLDGDLSCKNGCLGYGTCEKICPFDAIHVVDGVAKVDNEKCTACSKCVAECPRNIISLVKEKQKVTIPCSSTDKGGECRKYCKNSCIGCKMCQKECPFDAIEVENNLAKIDYNKCKNCGKCVGVCPQKIIKNTRVVKKVEPKTA